MRKPIPVTTSVMVAESGSKRSPKSARKATRATRKAAPTDAQATSPTRTFDSRRPRRPFTRKPASGSAGTSQRGTALALHEREVVDVHRRLVAEDRPDDGQPHRRLGRRHGHHHEDQDVTGHVDVEA